MHTSKLILNLTAAVLLPAGLLASEGASIKAPLHGTGDPDAVGVAVATLKIVYFSRTFPTP